MATSTVKLNGTTLMTVNDTTAVAADVVQGKVFTAVDGTKTTGTASSGAAPQKQVNFIDYDGTILYSYTAQEANALSALPANPSHSGLTAQGWNWTLQEIKAQLTAMPDAPVWVGQMYITQSGDTEIDVHFVDAARLSPVLTICVNGTVTVDWGDNTTADTVTGSSLYTVLGPSHTYSSSGDYTIKIHSTSGQYAFYGSNSYTLLRKSGVMNENRVYAACVQAIRIGSGATAINQGAFTYCVNLTHITIPNSITAIGVSAFRYCYNLLSITIPSGITTLPQLAISSCQNLIRVAIPSSVTSIGSTVFSSCYNLSSITLPSGITSIDTGTFSNCYSLTSITIPSRVTSISGSLFASCYNLESITLPSGLTSIGGSAFQNCYNLESITLPSTVTSIGISAFQSCYGLKSITIPSGVTSLGNYAFSYCQSLKSITIPSLITSIGEYTFNYCYSLTSITILGNVTSVNNYAFSYCYSLNSITLPNSVTTIGNNTFSNCVSLTSITIPSDVTTIGNSTFHSCFGVSEYHIKPTTPPTLGTTAFANIVSDCVIYVPAAKLVDYQNAENWSAYASYMQGE